MTKEDLAAAIVELLGRHGGDPEMANQPVYRRIAKLYADYLDRGQHPPSRAELVDTYGFNESTLSKLASRLEPAPDELPDDASWAWRHGIADSIVRGEMEYHDISKLPLSHEPVEVPAEPVEPTYAQDEFGSHVPLTRHKPDPHCPACKKFVRTLAEADDLLRNSRAMHRAEWQRRKEMERRLDGK